MIAFRTVVAADLPMLRSWLAQPHVAPWWQADDADLLAVARGDDPTEGYVIELDGRGVGYIQLYAAVDSLPSGVGDNSPLFERCPRAATAGLDLFLGDRSALGHGPAILRAFLADIVFPRFAYAVLDPSRANARAIRAFEKAGFAQSELAGDAEHAILVAAK
jgi:aminoglycoside 6'-N-acetyltransferase